VSSRGLSQADLDLIEFCTCTDEHVAAAWSKWLGGLPSAVADANATLPRHWLDLLPLLALRQRQHRLAGPDWLLSRLRTAAVLEERRLPAVRRTTAEILAVPAIASANPVVIGGLGIGETAYPDAASRHTGILSLMLATGTDLPHLAKQLEGLGYHPRHVGRRARYWPLLAWARIWLTHPSGFQVYVFAAPQWRRRARLAHAGLLSRARRISCAEGLVFLAPCAADALALLDLGIGREHSPMTLLPAVDAVLLRRTLGRGDEAEPTIDDRRWPTAAAEFQRRPIVRFSLPDWLRAVTDPARRDAERLMKERPHELYQAGGRTSLDRYPHLFAALRDSLYGVTVPDILSYGCSTGEEIVSLRNYIPHGRFAGIDINPTCIRKAKLRVADSGVRLWAAASIGETDAGEFDAIACLSVLHRNEILKNWPADPTPYLSFEHFERAVLDLDRHLRPGGVLLLFHSSFRFVDTSVAPNYKPLLVVGPHDPVLSQRYDRQNQPILEPPAERYALYRKER
jgi:SAM-dependent methyltransferase